MSRARNPVHARIQRLVEYNSHVAPSERTRQAGKHQSKCKHEQALRKCPLPQVSSLRKSARYGVGSWSFEIHIVINTFPLFLLFAKHRLGEMRRRKVSKWQLNV